MPLYEKHPPHVRRRIALFWTLGIGVVLISLLIIRYTRPQSPVTAENDATPGSKFKDFYETISETTQSFFEGK